MFIDENSKPKEKLKAWYLFTEDFVAGTQHLNNQELGIYIRLLCWNWNKRCSGIPNDENIYYRIALALTDEEKLSCVKVIKENFRPVENHWQNERQLQEYLYITKRIDASKSNGKLGGRPKKPTTNPPTSTPTSTSSKSSKEYNPLFNKFWDKIDNKISKGIAEKNFLKVEDEWKEKAEDLADMYNKYYNSVPDKQFAKQPAFWLSAKKYLDEIPKIKNNFGIIDRDETTLTMFVDAIKNKKVTRFIKDWAYKHKNIVDRGIKEGKITKEQAINDLEMRNEYR